MNLFLCALVFTTPVASSSRTVEKEKMKPRERVGKPTPTVPILKTDRSGNLTREEELHLLSDLSIERSVEQGGNTGRPVKSDKTGLISDEIYRT